MISEDNYLNIHSHNTLSTDRIAAVRNIVVSTDPGPAELSLREKQWLSAGIHPWYIDEAHTGQQLGVLESLGTMDDIIMLGECGLDRLKGPSLDLQIEVFRAHIVLAERLNKPLIIHCVRCFNELLEIKKELTPQVPLIIHGYNNNEQIAEQLLKHGFYLSFGATLLRGGSNAETVFTQVPADRFFLETGDKDASIEEIYDTAARLRNISLNELKRIIFANYLSLGI